jgi:hypothetical protein
MLQFSKCRSRERSRLIPTSPPFAPGRLLPAASSARLHVRTASTSAFVTASIGFCSSRMVVPCAAGISARRRTATRISIILRPPSRRVGVRTWPFRYASHTSPNVSATATGAGATGAASGSTNVPPRMSARRRSRQMIASSFVRGASTPRACASFVREYRYSPWWNPNRHEQAHSSHVFRAWPQRFLMPSLVRFAITHLAFPLW